MHDNNIRQIINGAFSAAIRAGETISFETPLQWAEKHIIFRQVKSASLPNLDLSSTPYLNDIISYWDFAGKIRELTVVAPEQMGKSLGGWQVGLLWSFLHKRCLSMVVYPSDDKCEKINQDVLQPLMREIPKLAEELSLPKTKTKDCYRFSNFTSYFQGAGSRISSYSTKIVIADEVAEFVDEKEAPPILKDMVKRMRQFDESMFAKASSIKGGEGCYQWQEFLKSSQGYWHLRCLKCGELTLRSCDVHNLQWEMDGEQIIESSIRLVCPACGNEHQEMDKREMNLKGGYIHLFPALFDSHAGFQWGALASQKKSLCWRNIAEAQLNAGKSAEVKNQIDFDNSWRGLPFRQRKSTEAAKNKLIQHCAPLPDPNILEGLFIAADTQDDGWYWLIRGIDSKENTYKLEDGFCKTLQELESAKQKGWNGIPCIHGIIDEGGHREKDVTAWLKDIKGWNSYKGDSRIGTRFKPSDNKPKLILAMPKQYQSDLLYYIHQQDNRENSYWFLPPELSETYMNHILDMKPAKSPKFGHLYENWESSGQDHCFDCEKMMLVLLDYARKYFGSSKWRAGKGAWINRKKVQVIKSAGSAGGFVAGWNK